MTRKRKRAGHPRIDQRDSVRARLRNMVRILLRRYKYPPDKADEAIDLVLKQAEVLSEGWSAL